MSTLDFVVVPKPPAPQPSFNKILESYSTQAAPSEEKLGEEATDILQRLPKIHYMLSKVFMFPIKENSE